MLFNVYMKVLGGMIQRTELMFHQYIYDTLYIDIENMDRVKEV